MKMLYGHHLSSFRSFVAARLRHQRPPLRQQPIHESFRRVVFLAAAATRNVAEKATDEAADFSVAYT
jgi:hypothetical protein